MSMLTPPGMGGQYRIKGDRYPRMRRPRNRGRIVAASVAAVTALGLAAWGTLQLVDVFTGDGGSGSARAAGRPGEECRAERQQDARQDGKRSGTAPGAGKATRAADRPSRPGAASAKPLPEPASITVNVLNATPEPGLAAKTAKELKKRGFTIGEVANAPAALDKKVKATGLLIGATGADTTARLKVLGTHLKGAGTRYDDRKGDAVDLVIGDGFKKLTAAGAADRAVAALASPPPSPSPTPGC